MIVPDQKVTIGALNVVVWVVVEYVKSSSWNGGGYVPIGAPTLKLAEIREWGFRGKIDSTLGTSKSPLYIEVEDWIAVVMAHLGPAVTKSWEV